MSISQSLIKKFNNSKSTLRINGIGQWINVANGCQKQKAITHKNCIISHVGKNYNPINVMNYKEFNRLRLDKFGIYTDIELFSLIKIPFIMIFSENIMLYNCSANYIFFNLNKFIFPKAKNIILFSDVEDKKVLERWNNKIHTNVPNIYTHQRYIKCDVKLTDDNVRLTNYDNVILLSNIDKMSIMNNLILPSEKKLKWPGC